MSEMIGMDVDAVRRTASELRRKAGEIRAVEARVDAIVGQINGSWQGNTARRFVSDWHGHHRAALLLLADRVDGLGQSALNHAGEQESASGAGAGVSSGSAGIPGGASGWDGFVAGLEDGLPYATGLLGLAATFSSNKYSIGRYTNSWRKVMALGSHVARPRAGMTVGDLLHFKRSPVFHVLNDHQTVLKGGANIVGRASDVASGVDSVSDAYYAFRSGDVRNGAADGVNSLTRAVDATAGKVPVVRAGTFAVRTWAEVGRAATSPDIDWSAKGFSQVVTASPGDWAAAIKETLPQFKDIVFKKIW